MDIYIYSFVMFVFGCFFWFLHRLLNIGHVIPKIVTAINDPSILNSQLTH